MRSTPVPIGGSRWSTSPSISVSTTKAGHIVAPRSRQRIRAGQKRSSRFTDRRVAFKRWLSSGSHSSGRSPTGRRSRSRSELRERRQAGEIPDTLLVLEHPPVYTKGRRTEPADLPMGEDWYRAQGIEVHDTDRGGRVTYHGPGQLVGYPIMRRSSDVPDYVHTMERAMIAALADEGVEARSRARPHRRLGGRRARSARSACTCRAA